MSLHENICEALAGYLRNNQNIDVQKVVDFEDTTASGGYCETCYYEYAAVEILYLDAKGRQRGFTYDGPFSELIQNL